MTWLLSHPILAYIATPSHCLSSQSFTLCLLGNILLSFLARLQNEWPLLIVVPASLRLSWVEEIEKWLPHLRPSSIHIIYGKTDRLPSQSEAQVDISHDP